MASLSFIVGVSLLIYAISLIAGVVLGGYGEVKEKFNDFMLDNIHSRRIESDGMERDKKEPLYDTVNAEMAETLETWHRSPYSSATAGKINTLIRLVQSAGYGTALEINKKSWEDKNAAEQLLDIRSRIGSDRVVIEIDPQQKVDKNEAVSLHAYADHPTDEYTASTADFTIRSGNGNVTFSPEEVLSLKILERRTFENLKEVKDTYWPNVPDEEFLRMMDTGEIPESLKRTVEIARKANEPESEPE